MPGTTTFRDFERDVITRLCTGVLSASDLQTVLQDAEFVDVTHSGWGYHLTVRHALLPKERCIGQAALVLGHAGDVQVGFVAYLENSELTLDCHNMGGGDGVPHRVRDLPLVITSSDET